MTVSYGTFSCTLEGFDDSFGTMKAIAEYFRDLAADDRYFGAEPPQPDAEMLARIAEREVSRRVEAREQEGRIVLSAQPATPAAPETAPAALAVSDIAARAPDTVAPEPLVAEAEAEVAEAPVADAAPEVAETDEDDAAVDLDSITAALDAAEEEEAPQVEDAVAEDEIDAPEARAVTADDTEDEDTANAFFADSPTDSVDDTEDEAEAVAEDITDAEPVEEAAAPAPDSIAAKLQRIRAVVSQSKEDVADDEMFEDEHADAFVPSAEVEDIAGPAFDADETAEVEEEVEEVEEESLADALAAIDDAAEADAAGGDVLVDHTDEADETDNLADLLAQYDTDALEADAVAPVSDEAEAEGSDSLAADLDTDTDDAETADADASKNLFDDTAEELEVDASEDNVADVEELEVEGSEDSVADVEDTDVEDAPEAPAPRRARIIKVKRADIDAALANGQIEEITDEDGIPDEDGADAAASSLSDAEEAELQAELDAVEAEFPASDTVDAPEIEDALTIDDAPLAEEEVAEAEAEAEADTAEETEEPQIADADVSRLMAEADSQMEEPEGSRRRNAFQHLKAAVMAKKADAAIGDDTVKDEGAFRSDLASVVVPRRPAASGGARDDRPAVERPAPLKLVAEQRVDIEGAASNGPVRPRRVAQTDEDEVQAAADGSFADYAADMGAHSLPDLLEAAASYLSFVEGHDQFSRPQLMTKVRQVEKEDFSREDGLRSFGQLLRAGKIEKQKGGRFTVTSDIGYRPDEREAS
ncbi:MAG: hypothetical protein AAFZ99_10920 [Pseudomonadota bacterium]